MLDSEFARILHWDSQFFGFKVAMLDSVPSRTTLATVAEWATFHKVRCIYAQSHPSMVNENVLLSNWGFKLVDVRVEHRKKKLGTIFALQERLGSFGPSVRYREAGPNDIKVLQDCSRSSFRKSRFYADWHFGLQNADALFDEWIAQDCRGVDGRVMVVGEEANGAAAAFWSGRILPSGIAVTGLGWISERYRGKGLSLDLFNALELELVKLGATEILAATQATNDAAVRMHERVGFKYYDTKLWYHNWLY